jgi:hypothetical protein
MAILQITRPNEWLNRARSYKIFLNGEKVGTIKNNSTLDLNVIPEGTQTLVAKIDWCSSPEIDITIKGDETKYIEVSSSKSLKWMLYIVMFSIVLGGGCRRSLPPQYRYVVLIPFLLFIIYMVSIGRKNYLRIKEF